ncbi:MAG: flagellar motor protein, partial [Alicyclobacillus sp.]|nr:flagellar motor protein [Alicyclobacillus sp.]
MDFATISGVLLAVVSLVIGFASDGGNLRALIQPTAFLIVVGGTLGATLTSVSLEEFKGFFKYLRISLFTKQHSPLDIIDDFVQLAIIARREGLLALEDNVVDLKNEFMQKGIQLVVDGTDQGLIKSMLETELAYINERHEAVVHIFEMAGGFAPTMGIIGTVMGLVHVLSDLSSVDTLGSKIATAFTATLYGVASANVFWLPLANKLKRRHLEEYLMYEMIVEGVMSVAVG